MPYPSNQAYTTLAALKARLDPQPSVGGYVGQVLPITVGSGYTHASVGFGAGSGSVTASAIIVGGAVVGYVVTNKGTQNADGSAPYQVPPTVTISGDGTGATAQAILTPDDVLQALINDVSVTISQQVSGFVAAPGTPFTITVDRWRAPQSLTVSGLVGAGLGRPELDFEALEAACIVTCMLWWKRRAHVDQNSQAAPSGIGSINFVRDDLPKEAWTNINKVSRNLYIAVVGQHAMTFDQFPITSITSVSIGYGSTAQVIAQSSNGNAGWLLNVAEQTLYMVGGACFF